MRDILPNRREGFSLNFLHHGLEYTATMGRYPDKRIGEIFLRCSKTGTDVSVACQEPAIIASFALQNGATIEQMRSAMPRNGDGSPEGPMGRLFDMLVEGA